MLFTLHYTYVHTYIYKNLNEPCIRNLGHIWRKYNEFFSIPPSRSLLHKI